MSWLGSALGLASAVSWACANLSIKPASQRFGSWGALVWAQLIGGAMGAVVAFAVDGRPRHILSALLPLGVAAAAAGAAYGGLFAALARGQLAIVTPIISAWAVISVATAVLAGDETLSATGAAGVALVVMGNAVLAQSGSQRGGATPPSALWWALVSALGFGMLVPAIDRAGDIVGPLWTVPLVWSAELCVAIPILWWLGQLRQVPRSARDAWLVGRAATFEVGGFIALSVGLAYAPVTVVSPLSSLSTAASVALGVWVLRERVRPVALAGAVAASAGVVLVNL